MSNEKANAKIIKQVKTGLISLLDSRTESSLKAWQRWSEYQRSVEFLTTILHRVERSKGVWKDLNYAEITQGIPYVIRVRNATLSGLTVYPYFAVWNGTMWVDYDHDFLFEPQALPEEAVVQILI